MKNYFLWLWTDDALTIFLNYLNITLSCRLNLPIPIMSLYSTNNRVPKKNIPRLRGEHRLDNDF